MLKCLKKSRLNLTILLSLHVFMILVFTGAIIGFMFYATYKMGISISMNAHNMFFMMALSSTIIGTILSLFLGRLPLKPIRKLIAAMEEVAHGNFSVRLQLEGSSEYGVLTKSFNKMVEELASYEILRADFVNNFSHEFKTPIVSLRGFAKLLKNPALTTQERNEYLDIIISEADRLSSLATNTLNLSKVENLGIQPARVSFDLAEQIRRVVLMLETKWDKKGIEPIVDLEECVFYGNEDLLHQVWMNLLDNAVKFSPEHSQVWISLESRENRAIFRVTDQGIGMEEAVQKHIFDKFYQADKSHKMQGNGIGLAIVKKVVELYDGEIVCESASGKGTTFIVSLPNAQRNTL